MKNKKLIYLGIIGVIVIAAILIILIFNKQNKIKTINLTNNEKETINTSLKDLNYLLRTTGILTNEGSNIYKTDYNYLESNDTAFDFAIQSLTFDKTISYEYDENEGTDLKITVANLNNYYQKLYGKNFVETLISDDTKSGFSIENDKVLSSFNFCYMGPLYFLKANHKEYNPKTKAYTLYVDYLAKADGTFFDSETEDINFSEPNILEYSNDLKQATLILEYKINNDNSYQLNTLKFTK